MTKEKIINYAMSTPHNTNEAVLSAIINQHDKETLDNAGFVKTVNGQGPDEQGNVDVAAAVSWDDLEDKPFGEETVTYSPLTVSWDGNTEGLYSVMTKGDTYYKISDAIVPNEQIKLGSYTLGDDPELTITEESWNYSLEIGDITEDYVRLAEDCLIFVRKVNTEIIKSNFEEVGIYCSDFKPSAIINFPEITQAVVERLDPKFLPIPQLVIFYNDDSREATCSMTYDELSNILAQKKLLTTSYTFIDDASYYFGNVNDISKNSDQIRITATADMTSRRFVLSPEGFWLSVE